MPSHGALPTTTDQTDSARHGRVRERDRTVTITHSKIATGRYDVSDSDSNAETASDQTGERCECADCCECVICGKRISHDWPTNTPCDGDHSAVLASQRDALRKFANGPYDGPTASEWSEPCELDSEGIPWEAIAAGAAMRKTAGADTTAEQANNRDAMASELAMMRAGATLAKDYAPRPVLPWVSLGELFARDAAQPTDSELLAECLMAQMPHDAAPASYAASGAMIANAGGVEWHSGRTAVSASALAIAASDHRGTKALPIAALDKIRGAIRSGKLSWVDPASGKRTQRVIRITATADSNAARPTTASEASERIAALLAQQPECTRRAIADWLPTVLPTGTADPRGNRVETLPWDLLAYRSDHDGPIVGIGARDRYRRELARLATLNDLLLTHDVETDSVDTVRLAAPLDRAGNTANMLRSLVGHSDIMASGRSAVGQSVMTGAMVNRSAVWRKRVKNDKRAYAATGERYRNAIMGTANPTIWLPSERETRQTAARITAGKVTSGRIMIDTYSTEPTQSRSAKGRWNMGPRKNGDLRVSHDGGITWETVSKAVGKPSQGDSGSKGKTTTTAVDKALIARHGAIIASGNALAIAIVGDGDHLTASERAEWNFLVGKRSGATTTKRTRIRSAVESRLALAERALASA